MRGIALAALLLFSAQGVEKPAPVEGLPSYAALVESVKAAVVNVEVVARVKAPQEYFEGDPFFRQFFGEPGREPPREQLRQGAGSGFIIREDGLALTNNHMVEGASSIRVRLEDGRQFTAKVLGRDPLTDVALIQLENAKALPVVKLGDSDAMRVGDPVVAIGNPFGLASSVSAGIVSAKARNIGAGPYDDFLQTDAAINPGNSGGPLFDAHGRVIGMNTAIVGGGSGIGFAVPSNLINALLPQLEKSGAVTRGWFGVAVQNLTPELSKGLRVPLEKGALVSEVKAGSPAAKAGLERDDVITSVNGEPVESAGTVTRKVALMAPGTTVKVQLYRAGKLQRLEVTLGTRPNLEKAAPRAGAEPNRQAPQRHEKYGLTVEDVPQDLAAQKGVPPGAFVVDVEPGSPADRAELTQGMLIIEAAGKPVRSSAELQKALDSAQPGTVLLLRIQVGEGGKVLRALPIPEGHS